MKKNIMMTEQEKLAKVVIDEWSNLFWDNIGKEIDKKKFKENIDLWYKDYFKKPLPKIVYCDSLKGISKLDIGKDIMYSQRIKILKDLSNKLPKLSEQVKPIANSVFSKVNPRSSFLFEEISWGLIGSSGFGLSLFIRYSAYFDFLDRIGISDPLVKLYIELSKTPSFLIMLYEDSVLVIQSPIEVNIENGLIHSIKGPSLKFKDGIEYYFIRGVEVEKDIFEKVRDKSITLEEILRIPNEEVKSAALLMYQELYGEEATYHLISESLKEVDSYFHKTGDKTLCYTLFKGKLGNRNTVAYIRCYCPSTNRMFFLGVDSRNTNAKDAIASLYRIPYLLGDHIKYINRQGERFTTVLTDKGNEIRKNMTKEDLSDLTTISGDDYFRLMRYEF